MSGIKQIWLTLFDADPWQRQCIKNENEKKAREETYIRSVNAQNKIMLWWNLSVSDGKCENNYFKLIWIEKQHDSLDKSFWEKVRTP